MNNKQTKVLNELVKQSKKYTSASMSMVRVNLMFFQSYHNIKLTKQEEEQVLNSFTFSTHLVLK